MRLVFCALVFVLLLCGCAGLQRTYDEVRSDPTEFYSDAQAVAATAKQTFPELPPLAALAIGYGLCFIRNWYKGTQRDLAKLRTNGSS